jgi:hypothetical protein
MTGAKYLHAVGKETAFGARRLAVSGVLTASLSRAIVEVLIMEVRIPVESYNELSDFLVGWVPESMPPRINEIPRQGGEPDKSSSRVEFTGAVVHSAAVVENGAEERQMVR